MIRKVGAVVAVLMLLACSPGLSRRDPVPEPVPDHGRVVPTLAAPVTVTLQFFFDVFDVDGHALSSQETDVLLVTAHFIATGPVLDEAGNQVPSPTSIMSRTPAVLTIQFERGTMTAIRTLTTLLHGHPGLKLQCRAVLDGIDLPTPGARDAKIWQSNGLISPVLCEAAAL
jgi:hypothetical protein